MLRRLLPWTFKDKRPKHAQGAPARFKSRRIEGPVADAVVAGERQVERIDFHNSRRFKRLAGFIDGREVDLQPLIARVGRMRWISAGKPAEFDPVNRYQLVQAILRKRRKRSSFTLKTVNTRVGGLKLLLK